MNDREETVLALVRLQDRTFPLLPIKPLNSIPYTGELLGGLGPTKIYELIKLERLDARKLGSQTRITGESIKALIDSLPKGVASSPQPEGRHLSERDRTRAPARAEHEFNDLK